MIARREVVGWHFTAKKSGQLTVLSWVKATDLRVAAEATPIAINGFGPKLLQPCVLGLKWT